MRATADQKKKGWNCLARAGWKQKAREGGRQAREEEEEEEREAAQLQPPLEKPV